MTSLLSAELSATCNALGNYDIKTQKYLIDEYTLNTVKDLIRYLRRDGEDHEIRIHLGQTKVLQTDLVPMLSNHWENTELFDVTLRLLVNLTNPVLLLFREEVPTESTARRNYIKILSHLQSYKEDAFTKVDIWAVLAKKLAKVLEIDWSERDEDTGLIIERVLILIRNILHVPADLDKERRPDNDASVHDQVLWALNQSGMLDIILYMSSENEKQYFMHILEIITHLLREQNPTDLANAALQRSVEEKLRDEQELISLTMTEAKNRNNKVRQYSSARHSRFGGTYTVHNMKSISDNEIICLKPLNDISKIDFGVGGKKEKYTKPKNRRPVESGTKERRSAFAIRLFLKEFCIEFLNGSYNPFMHYVKDVLVRAKAQKNDETYYLTAVKFFMEFNRGCHLQVGLVSETMSVSMFHYIQQLMENYYDMIKVEKKKFVMWVRRLHLALRAYKELLHTLIAMDKSIDSSVKESAKVIKSNIFYVVEYREFVLAIFLAYNDSKMPRSYLVDLVETEHLYLKMLEHYCKKTGLVVQKKVRRKNKSKKQKAQITAKPLAPVATIVLPEWEEVRAQLAAVMTGLSTHEYPPPFDAASDTPIDEQKESCMKNIQKLMRECKYEDAVGVLRAAREVWSEEGIFGEVGMPEEEELNMMGLIYNADLGVEFVAQVNSIEEQEHSVGEGDNDDNEEDEEEEEEGKTTTIVETEFDFQDFVYRYCHPTVISACAFLLEQYDKNSPQTNHCAIKILHRIAWDCKRPSMMFQATLFVTFQKILNNPSPLYKELHKFAIFILRKFTEIATNTPKTFTELLFWKTTKDANEIEHGYTLYSDSKPTKGAWTEEQEEELRKLYMENQENPTTEKDVIDWMLDNLVDQTRSRKGVIKKLKDLGLIFKAPTKKSNAAREKVSKEFGEDEDELLRDLWSAYNETNDPMGEILQRMPRKRSKNSYIERLLKLGIIDDRKQCRKKRSKKSDGHDETSDDEHSSNDTNSASNNSDSEDSENARKPTPVRKKPKAKSVKKTTNNKPKNTVIYSVTETAKLLIKAVENDLTEALKWIAENLEEIALDQEAEGYDPEGEGIPIVPISSDCVKAMDNKLFQEALKGLGIKPPSDEQESYWRIPSTLHFETLRSRREIVIKAIDKTLVIEADSNQDIVPPNDNAAESSDDDSLFAKLRQISDTNTGTTKVVNKSNPSQLRKRSRSVESPESFRNSKIQRIEEENESDKSRNNEDEDILSFVKGTIQSSQVADTEDIFSNIHRQINVSGDKEEDSDEEILTAKRDNKKRRLIIDDDSD